MRIALRENKGVMKEKHERIVKIIVIILVFTFLSVGCQKDNTDSTEIKKEHIRGFVQKGPFINGTQILMSELNADLEQTGKLFSTEIVSNTGLFQINDIALTSNFVQFSGSGFYFDEVKGEASASQLTLFALSDITDLTSVNVNIMTHLERRRVEYLIGQDISFSEAKETAQSEILAIFGFENSEMDESENLDITVDNNSNAILLAISVILQGNRSVADLTELLAQISGDLREDGVLNDETIMVNIRNSTLQLDLEQIRQNLETRYQELGIEANIPPFEDYIQIFLSSTAGEPFAETQTATDITATGATLQGIVNPNSALTNVIFEYGISESYGSELAADSSPVSGNGDLPVQVTIGSLDPATTYHYRVKAVNEHGEYVGQNSSFMTLGNIPLVFGGQAEAMATSAIFSGIVNPNFLSTTVIFEWGTDGSFENFVIADQGTLNGNDDIPVTAEAIGLLGNTEYEFRIKAENELGFSYSEEISFKTFHSTVTDSDGNIYVTTKVGNQIWMAENLRTSHYQNGEPIILAQSNDEWGNTGDNQIAAHSSFESDISNDEAYGRYYNWYAVNDSRNICPQDWRVPGKDDWTTLILSIDPDAIENGQEYFFIESLTAGNDLKSKKTMPEPQPSWQQPNNFSTNQTMFSALPTGFRYNSGEFFSSFSPGRAVRYWSADEYSEEPFVWVLEVDHEQDVLGHMEGVKYEGYAVRCIKN